MRRPLRTPWGLSASTLNRTGSGREAEEAPPSRLPSCSPRPRPFSRDPQAIPASVTSQPEHR